MRFLKSREFGTLLVLLAMLAACEVGARQNGTTFLTADQLGRVLRDFSFVGIAALGACMVILSGGVDLSSGSVMGLGAVTLSYLYMKAGASPAVALAAALLAGGLAGCVNGLLVGKVGIPPFIATLGMLSVARGAGYWITGGPNIELAWEERGGSTVLFPLLGNASVAVLLVLAAGSALLMARFSWGRYVYAVGGNEEAARFAGLRVGWIKTGVYAAAGLFSGLAGCAYGLRYGTGSVAVGQGYELQIIAACAVGGASFSGGQGSVAGAVLGAATLQVLRELLIQLNVQDKYIEIAYGCTIVLAVAVDQFRQRPVLSRWFGRKTA